MGWLRRILKPFGSAPRRVAYDSEGFEIQQSERQIGRMTWSDVRNADGVEFFSSRPDGDELGRLSFVKDGRVIDVWNTDEGAFEFFMEYERREGETGLKIVAPSPRQN